MTKGFRDGTDEFVAVERQFDDVVVAVTAHSVPVVITRKTLAPVGVVDPVRAVGVVVKLHEGINLVIGLGHSRGHQEGEAHQEEAGGCGGLHLLRSLRGLLVKERR